MTLEEANKIIAEYMGYELVDQPHSMSRNPLKMTVKRKFEFEITAYSKSLDALVPVWDKLGYSKTQGIGFHRYKSGWQVGIGTILPLIHLSTSVTLQEAACLATAKAIKELKEKNNG